MSIETTGEGDWAERTEARVLAEALTLAPEHGWTWRMTKAAGAAAGLSLGETELLLPNGPRDLAALQSRACDAAALAALAEVDPASLKVRERIRRGVLAWMAAAMRNEAAMRRWCGFLALPAPDDHRSCQFPVTDACLKFLCAFVPLCESALSADIRLAT